uniref:lymphocyte antigen 75 n=1 Tax=Euleptes europaea TaxID=460621 RepID=UPI002542599F|nr:lymphocyte antigen 75 [Euleptes europaea]
MTCLHHFRVHPEGTRVLQQPPQKLHGTIVSAEIDRASASPPSKLGSDVGALRGMHYDNAFTIQHKKTNKCIQVKNVQISAGDCQGSKEALWTWVSQHRLFNLGSRKCLGLDITKTSKSLIMVECDSNLILWWRCADDLILTANENKLALKGELVTVSKNSSDSWRRNNSSDVVCKYPYHETYTREGNSYGKPCEFPFLCNKSWHYDCIHNDRFPDGEWCSTTYDFDQDRKWGYCLKPEDGCQNTWEYDEASGSCLQLNPRAYLSWKEAYVSCQRQGGDLLSITNVSILSYFKDKDGIAEIFWIGLNQLDNYGGWQWSDHTPLHLVSWGPEMQNSSPLDGTSCVVMNADTGLWKSYPCETALPYVCKKPFNGTKLELPEVQDYRGTQCNSDWLPHNGFCYTPVNNPVSWEDAQKSCKAQNSDLMSIHSLADVELVVSKLHNETNDKMWIGFKNKDVPASFKWADGSKVVFTYWDLNEPNIPFNNPPNCVAYSGKLGRWKVLSCDKQLKYVCMKKGKVLNETTSGEGCPTVEWKRHGHFCYKILNDKVSFGTRCNLTIENRFEQEFINSLIRKHSTVEEKYFWTGLQDLNSLGEYSWGSAEGNIEKLSYTNWDSLQPEYSGGCVAMASGKHLGKWKVQSCSTFKAYSICKNYTGPPRPTEVLPKITDPCPPGWYNGSGLSCYKIFHKERVLRTRTWEEAERFCEALGGHLPSFSHKEETREFHNILRTVISDDRWVWVGLNKRNPEYLASWQWSDNKPVSTILMSREFKEDEYDIRECAAFKSFRTRRRPFWPPYLHEDREYFYLKPFRCDAKLEWACQITKGTKIKTPEWYKPGEDKIHGPPLVIDGSEFWFVSNKNLTYQEAALYCSNNGSDLASLTSFTELTGVLNRLENLSDKWQNWWLKSVAPASHFHSWFPVYSHYHERYGRDCWHISSHSWYRDLRIDCNLKLPFICEKYNASLLERHDPDYRPPKKQCPDHWQVFQNKCFQTITPRSVTFKEANEQCETLGGFLPSIKSQAEQDFITSLLPNMPEDIWIGLQFLVKTHENKWVDGSELLYTNFHPLIQGRVRNVLIDIFNEDVTNQCGVLLNNPNSLYIGAWNFTSCADNQTLAICQRKQDAVFVNQTQEMLNITTNYLNITYTIILKNLTWYDALQECQLNNMQLVSITEQYQQAFLASQAAHHNYPLWIGLSSKDDGIHYQWSDGKQIRFSYWSEEEDEDEDDCVYLDSSGAWKTSECDIEKPGAICYLPRSRNETKETEEYGSVICPHKVKNTPWIPFQNSCYTFTITKDRWKEVKLNEAHHLCKTMNANASVLSIKNENENRFVVEQLQTFSGLAHWVWLGLIYDKEYMQLKWYDETYLSFNKWRLGRPYIRNNNFFAGVNLDGLWDIYNYTEKWPPIRFNHYSVLVCKIEMGPKENKSPLPEMQQYGNNTYWILQKKLSWYNAWKECKQRGRDLASIHSESQQLFLEDIVKRDGFSLWLGLSSHDGNESDFEWSDGSSFHYRPWEYESSHSPGDCVFLDTSGLWKHMKCTDALDGAICYSPLERRLSKQTESFTTCPHTSSGSSQWIQYKDYCYAFNVEFYNFSIYSAKEAEKVCQKLDPSATLLTIKDEKENKFVVTYLQEHHFVTKRVWLGINPKGTGESLRWLDGSEVKYTNWEKGSENASADCSIVSSTTGRWNKIDCSKGQSRVVCKVPRGSSKAGVVIAFTIIIVLASLAGLIWFLYKKKQLQWAGFSSVRYERGLYEDESHSMFTNDDDSFNNCATQKRNPLRVLSSTPVLSTPPKFLLVTPPKEGAQAEPPGLSPLAPTEAARGVKAHGAGNRDSTPEISREYRGQGFSPLRPGRPLPPAGGGWRLGAAGVRSGLAGAMGGVSPLPGSCLLGGLLLAAAWPSPGGADACPSSSWISFGSSCYALLQATLESIDDAREFCKASGASIISINNKEENTFILKAFHTHWHGPEYISLGMFFDTDDDVFKWYDESKVNFTNWLEEENSNELLDTCATMQTTSGGWKKTSCEHLPLTEILCEATCYIYPSWNTALSSPYSNRSFLDFTVQTTSPVMNDFYKTWTTVLVITSTVIVSVSAAFLWFLYQRKVSSTTSMAYSFSRQMPCNDEMILVDEENEYTA